MAEKDEDPKKPERPPEFKTETVRREDVRESGEFAHSEERDRERGRKRGRRERG